MADRKWYVVHQSAEGHTTGVIDLTKEELAVVNRVLDYETVKEDSWCGGFWVDDEPYDTKEDAVRAALLC